MLTFFSQRLVRTIGFEEIASLTEDEAEQFHTELKLTIYDLENVLAEATAKEKVTGIAIDEHWRHRVGTKRRIALKFASELHSKLHGGTTVPQRVEYERIYRSKFRAMLEKEFGPTELVEIEAEIATEAKAEYRGWLDKTGQHAWFAP